MSDVSYSRAEQQGMLDVSTAQLDTPDTGFDPPRESEDQTRKPKFGDADYRGPDPYGRPFGDPLYGYNWEEGDGENATAVGVNNENAYSRLKAFLSEFGLENMEDKLNDLLARGYTGAAGDESAVMLEIRNTEAYQKRFAANAKRMAAGLPGLSPREYIGLERSYREILRTTGMIDYFNRQDIFEGLIAGEVSPQELYDRVNDAYNEVVNADAATKTQMRELYQVDDKDLVAYFLNPSESVTMLKRRAEAAKLAARASEQAGLKLTAQTAEDLAARGVTLAEAQKQFGIIAQQRELYAGIPGMGEDAFTQQEQVGAAFGFDEQAKQKLERTRQTRLAQFKGGGRFAATTGATSGSAETGIGMAQ